MGSSRKRALGLALAAALLFGGAGAGVADEPDVDALVAQLDRAVEPARAELMDAIVQRGEAAVPALRRGLMHWNPARRQACAQILSRIGHAAQPAREALLEGLIDESDAVRAACFVALGRSNPFDRMLAMKLNAHAATESSPALKRAALHGLMLLGPESASFLATRLKQPREREPVLDAIRTLGAQALPVLERLMRDPSWHARAWTARSLDGVEAWDAAWLATLVRALEDQSSAVRVAAARSLQARPEDPRIAPLLLPHLRNDEIQVRRILTCVLAGCDPLPAGAAVPLIGALGDDDATVRTNAAWALGQVPAAGDEVAEALRARLDDPEATVRISAARALLRRGDTGPKVLAVLADAARRLGMRPPFRVHHRDLGTGGRKFFDMVLQHSAVADVVALGAPALPALAFELKRAESAPEKLALIYALGHLGPAAAPLLETALSEEDGTLALAAACCLARFGERGAAAIPVLLREMVDPDGPIVIADVLGGDEIVDALIAIGPRAIPALREMRAAREDLTHVIDKILEEIEEQQPDK